MSSPPRGVGFRSGRRGQPGRPPRGCRPRNRYVRRIPGRRIELTVQPRGASRPSRPTRNRASSPGRTGTGRDNGGVQRPVPSDRSPTPRARTSSRTPTAGCIYVGQGQEPAQPGLSNYFVDRAAAGAHPRRWCTTADTVEWIEVRNEVEALFLEYNLIKKHRPRFNIRLKDDKSYPFLAVTLDEEWPRAMVMRGAQAQGRPLLRALRPRLRDPRDARPAAAHLPDPHVHERQVRPPPAARSAVPLRAHREVRRHRASAPSTTTSTWSSSTSCIAFLDGDTAPVLDRLDKQMHEAADELEFERAARAARPARLGAQGDRAPADGRRQARRTTTSSASPTTSSRRRCRSSSCARAASSGRKGLVVDKVEDVEPPRAGRPAARAALRRRRRRPTCPREILVPDRARRPRALRGVPRRCSAGRKVRVRVPQRGAKRELLETVDAERAARRSPATSCSARPTTTRAPGRWSRCRTRSSCPRRRCASSASTSPTCRAPRSSRRWW